MDPERWRKVSAVLDHLLDLPKTEQTDHLRQLRGDDPELCTEVESLLAQQEPSELLDGPPAQLMEHLSPTFLGALPVNPLNADTDPLLAGSPAEPIRMAGRYHLLDEIARGGMGAIFRARDAEIDRILAVKILLPYAQAIPDAEERFLQEARITGQLQHPGIPPIHELGQLENGLPFFAMKLIDGKTLTTLIGAPDFARTDARCVGIFEQICRTLAYAHSRGVIHRDLKPSNVMVGAFGEVQVMDWGLAKALNPEPTEGRGDSSPVASALPDSGSFSQAGDVIGTPAYMAPEQARGETDRLDERCDVFGLGGILCAILAGEPPFRGSFPVEIVRQAAKGDLAHAFQCLDSSGAEVGLIEVAKKCLAPNVENRYRNAGEVAQAVTLYRESVQEKLRQAELDREKAQVKAAEERRRRRLAVTLAASLLLLVLGIAGAGLWYQQFTAQRQARAQNLNALVARSLDDAETERQQLADRLTDPRKVHLLLSDLQAWQASLKTARAHVRQGRKLADSDATSLDSPVRERLDALEVDLTAAEQEEAFARDLDGIRLKVLEPSSSLVAARPRGGKPPLVIRAEEYADLFRANGWDIESGDPDAVLTALQASPVRFVAAIGLEDWAHAALTNKPRDEALVKRLLQMARGIDPDPWRDRFRQWSVWNDAAQFQQVTKDLKPGLQPPQALGTVAALQRHWRQDSTPLLRAALLQYPGDFWLNFQMGEIANERKNYEDGVGAYRAALAVRPNSYQALNNFGVMMGNKGDLKAAEELFAKALEHNPTFTKAHSNLGNVFFIRGNAAEAEVHFRAALKGDPSDETVQNNLGAALAFQWDMDGALVHIDAALKLSPNYHEAHNNRGIALRRLGQLEEAIHSMKRAHELQARPIRAKMIADYKRVLQLQKVETQARVEVSALEKGLAGTLNAELPLDLAPRTSSCYRASHLVLLKAGRHYQIDLTGDFDTLLRVEDGRYNSFAFNDDVRYPEIEHSRLIFTPQKDALFRLIVTTFKAKTTGAYELRIKEVIPLGPPVVVRDRLALGNQADSKGNFHKWHEMSLVADQAYTFCVESRDFDPHLRLADATRKKAYVQNDVMTPGKSRHVRLDYTPGTSGPFNVLVSTARPGLTGEYTLSVQAYGAVPQAPRR